MLNSYNRRGSGKQDFVRGIDLPEYGGKAWRIQARHPVLLPRSGMVSLVPTGALW